VAGSWRWPLTSVMPRLRMSGVIPLLPLCAFMTYTGTTSWVTRLLGGVRFVWGSAHRIVCSITRQDKRAWISIDIDSLLWNAVILLCAVRGPASATHVLHRCAVPSRKLGMY
jgi:hypothetical protein